MAGARRERRSKRDGTLGLVFEAPLELVPHPAFHSLGSLKASHLRERKSAGRLTCHMAGAHAAEQDAIFEDFAGEAVMLCMLSLQMAARMISVRADAHEIDGELFLLRHLLFLKELVRSIDLVHVSRASDFTSITGASWRA